MSATAETTTADPTAAKRERLEAATYTAKQAAERAGVGTRTVWRWIDAGRVPGVLRVGKVVRIHRDQFDAWLAGGGCK